MKKLTAALIALCLVAGITLYCNIDNFNLSVSALSKYGSNSDEVRQVQRALANLGYYSGPVDGVFGAKTKTAVEQFQKSKGLTVDGVVGSATLKALGIGNTGKVNQDNDYYLLARVISAEARGESYEGQVAVGAVILNRVEHSSFPDSISGVIYQKGAFTCMTDGQFNQPISESAYRAARDAMNGVDPSGGAIYYYNPATATSKWIFSRPQIKTIGKHVFCM